MTAAATNRGAEGAHALLADYQLRLPSFEGPLDVLLSLIERERLDISSLALVVVTDGFLAHIAALHNPPPTLLAEFATIAARLLLLKSRALLPRVAAVEPEEDADGLANQLREYQRVQQLAQALRETESRGLRSFVRPLTPPESLPAQRITLLRPPLAHLQRAMRRVQERELQLPSTVQLRQRISIGQMAQAVRDALRRGSGSGRPPTLHDIAGCSRERLVAGLIACLALTRRGEIDLEQTEPFGDIRLLALDVRQPETVERDEELA